MSTYTKTNLKAGMAKSDKGQSLQQPKPPKGSPVPAKGGSPFNALAEVMKHYESANKASQHPAQGAHPLPDNNHDCPMCGALSNDQNPEKHQAVMAHKAQNTQQGASGMPNSPKGFNKKPNRDSETDTGEN